MIATATNNRTRNPALVPIRGSIQGTVVARRNPAHAVITANVSPDGLTRGGSTDSVNLTAPRGAAGTAS